MIVSIKSAEYLDAYRLSLVFDTGESGDVDLRNLVFKYATALPLRDIDNFKSFKLDDWATVVWDCGFEISPEKSIRSVLREIMLEALEEVGLANAIAKGRKDAFVSEEEIFSI